MTHAHANAGDTTPEQSIHWPKVITWISVGILVGTEDFGAALAAAWAAGGLMELSPPFQYALYATAIAAGAAVMLPFMKRAAQIERLRNNSQEAQR